MKRIILLVCIMACCGCAGAQGWFELGTGSQALNANGRILTLCADDSNNIYAAGELNDSADGFGPFYVAKWNCMTHIWNKLGSGSQQLNANGAISTICVDKHGNVYAAGEFTDTIHVHTGWGGSGFGYNYVAKWDNIAGTWSELGIGANALHARGPINTICVDDSGNVYAAGNYRDTFGQSYVSKWDGSSWNELFGLNTGFGFIYSICVDDSLNVYAAGSFEDAAGYPYVAKRYYTTGAWTELGTGFDTAMADIEIRSISNIFRLTLRVAMFLNGTEPIGIYLVELLAHLMQTT